MEISPLPHKAPHAVVTHIGLDRSMTVGTDGHTVIESSPTSLPPLPFNSSKPNAVPE